MTIDASTVSIVSTLTTTPLSTKQKAKKVPHKSKAATNFERINWLIEKLSRTQQSMQQSYTPNIKRRRRSHLLKK